MSSIVHLKQSLPHLERIVVIVKVLKVVLMMDVLGLLVAVVVMLVVVIAARGGGIDVNCAGAGHGDGCDVYVFMKYLNTEL